MNEEHMFYCSHLIITVCAFQGPFSPASLSGMQVDRCHEILAERDHHGPVPLVAPRTASSREFFLSAQRGTRYYLTVYTPELQKTMSYILMFLRSVFFFLNQIKK